MVKNMIRAKTNKNDEFYTQYKDIEQELRHYTDNFKGKVIYCNADRSDSNFVKYFKNNFHRFKLKKLVNSCIDGYAEIYNGKNTVKLSIDGDFRSEDAIKLLQKSDIVITNPPFSLFREYIAQLLEYNKKFIIMGNFNSLAYKEIFPNIKNNKVWLGHAVNKTIEFRVADEYLKWDRKDKKGKKYGKVPSIAWFTNLPTKKGDKGIKLTEAYYGNETRYPKYDNYDAIEVGRVKDIPKDYFGVMGVPITYMVHHDPNQFEILGITHRDLLGVPCTKKYVNLKQGKVGEEFIPNSKPTNFSPKIVYKTRPNQTCYIADNVEGYMIIKYHRIFIKRKVKEKKTKR